MQTANNAGISLRAPDTLLTTRALDFLATGPADVVDLISHICNLPGAPRVVAEHLARAMFTGRADIVCGIDGRWTLLPIADRAHVEVPVPAAERLCDLSYVVVDVETTGSRPFAGDRITEIAAVVVQKGEIVEVFESLVNPGRPIPHFISVLTGITWEMVRTAPAFSAIAGDVSRVLSGNIFVAHNVAFDWRFVSAEIQRSSGQAIDGRRLCTVKLARKLLPHLQRRSLDYVANYYGVEIAGRHRAAGDAIATAHCLNRMIAEAGSRGCECWHDLETLLGVRGRSKRKKRVAMPTPITSDTTA